jgi:hypothetical protein
MASSADSNCPLSNRTMSPFPRIITQAPSERNFLCAPSHLKVLPFVFHSLHELFEARLAADADEQRTLFGASGGKPPGKTSPYLRKEPPPRSKGSLSLLLLDPRLTGLRLAISKGPVNGGPVWRARYQAFPGTQSPANSPSGIPQRRGARAGRCLFQAAGP